MRYLNLGCGSERWPDENWTLLDDLHAQLPPGSGARTTLDSEGNYRNFVVGSGPLPFDDGSLSGILASHFFEHFHAQDALAIMRDCLRILEPGGILLVSVPDARYFRSVYHEDRNENWPRLFDTSDPPNPIPTFFQAALWFEQHMQMFTEDALWAHFVRAGFQDGDIHRVAPMDKGIPALGEMMPRLNRRKFSLEMWGRKI